MLLSMPVTISIVGLVAYVLSYFISAIGFKEDVVFHRFVFFVCFIAITIVYVITVLKSY